MNNSLLTSYAIDEWEYEHDAMSLACTHSNVETVKFFIEEYNQDPSERKGCGGWCEGGRRDFRTNGEEEEAGE